MRHAAIAALMAAMSLAGTSPALCGTIVFNTANNPPNATADHAGICDRIMTEAFSRLGLVLKIVNLPSERALINANEGIDDGNFARVKGLEQRYPNLIRVAEEITTFEFVAFSARPAFRTAGWESLKPYNVGIITGWKILEEHITGVAALTKVRDERLLFGLLAAGKTDLVIYDRQQGRVVLKQLGLRGIRPLEPPLAVERMYPYLHKRHAALVPKLEQVLRAMKQDGTFQRIAAEALRPFADGD